MKIAFIGQKGIPTKQGGIEKHVEEMATRLCRAGFDVSVYSRPHYTGDYRQTYYYKNVKIINLPSLKTKNFDAISHTFLASLHALFSGYDIIHYHGVGPSLLSFIPRLFCPAAKVVATFHCLDRQHQKWGGFAKLMLALGERAACFFPHQTIAVSQTLKKYCAKNFNREATYIPNGVSLIGAKADKKILTAFCLQKNGYFVAISRLVKHKGIHTLIKAYQQIKTDKKLVIVGDGASTSDYVNELNDLAYGHKNIVFAGQQSGAALNALFKNAYAFVQPSEAEGMSIALLEAMAYQVPVIASNIPENLEVVAKTALTFKNKNINDLAKKMEIALRNPLALKKSAAAARERMKKNYLWPEIMKKTANLYRETATAPLVLQKAVV